MSKKLNLIVTIFLGLTCSALLLVIGVLAVNNYSPSFNINLTFNVSMATKIELAINDGTFYIIYDTSPTSEAIPTTNVSDTKTITNEEGEITENIITLGSVFSNLQSSDEFNFRIWNYNEDGTLAATLSATSLTPSDIVDQTSTPAEGITAIPAYVAPTASNGVIDFSVTVIKTTAIEINLNLVLTVEGS